jgi:hypothetical protein
MSKAEKFAWYRFGHPDNARWRPQIKLAMVMTDYRDNLSNIRKALIFLKNYGIKTHTL